MDFDETIRRRRMTRHFRPEPIPEAMLSSVLGAALRAPSAGFTQGVDLLTLTAAAARDHFWEVTSDATWRERGGSADGLLAAPAIVLPVADPDAYAQRYSEADKADTLLHGRDIDSWAVPYWLVDTALLDDALVARAARFEIGALFFQLHASEASILEGLGIPSERRLIGAVALGYPSGVEGAPSPTRRARRSFEEVVHRDSW